MDYRTRLAGETVRLLARDPYEAEDRYGTLIRQFDDAEHEAARLLIKTLLADMGEHWPDTTINRIEAFAWEYCCAKGIDPAETIADTVTFAVEMHDWNQIEEEE
ncbi:hypothetical protein [Bifidobacterium sp. SO1]|uniref:hypothetical protein n=1 Tax=Bifidobacterium sp. SO1 TaxID=2809029 RepID=UPI001BDCE24D|nr:hypothetical protein [Bifidobacterium sp. SO1]MBT1162121.1 hypothetical protein [Bifidobacterium sp. SO1]